MSAKPTNSRTNARHEVEKLLEQMRAQARTLPENVSGSFNRLTDMIETIVRTYLEPAVIDPIPNINLTPSEGRIFGRLALQMGHIVHKDMLLDALYFDKHHEAESKIIDVMICKMRRKLRGSRFAIEGIWGRGWVLKEAEHATAA